MPLYLKRLQPQLMNISIIDASTRDLFSCFDLFCENSKNCQSQFCRMQGDQDALLCLTYTQYPTSIIKNQNFGTMGVGIFVIVM